jgi:cytochrome c oxidase subunit 2
LEKEGVPHKFATDYPVVVPINKTVRVLITAMDVIHAWTIPSFGIKRDAVPGRMNQGWFKATKLGTYYGQCSELCGVNHAFMPITVEVVPQGVYDAWLVAAKEGDLDKGNQIIADYKENPENHIEAQKLPVLQQAQHVIKDNNVHTTQGDAQ